MEEHKAAEESKKGISRRGFLGSGAAAAAAITVGSSLLKGETVEKSNGKKQFKLKYAPYFGTFKQLAGDDFIDQLKFMADEGFTAMEDNDMMNRPVEEQEKLTNEMSRLGMTLGAFVSEAKFGEKTFVNKDASIRQKLVKKMQDAVETAKRVNAKWTIVVPGAYDNQKDAGYQTANVIENLKWCAEVCEPAGLVMIIEPLNFRDHPGLFLTKIPQAYQICRAVNSPSCKILNDLYHQQITEGNLIPNIDLAWDEIAHYHLGDNPGRREPTTGEINFKNIFKHLHEKGFKGVLGMEHGNSKPGKEGERAVIDAYAACDNF